MTEDDIIDSDGEINEAEHSNLLAAVTQLEGKQRVKPSTRKEPSLEVSEFHLVKSGTDKQDAVRVQELAQALSKHSGHSGITQKIQTTRRHAKTLPKPLEKPEANRIDRTVRYDNVKQQLDRWDAVVQANRLSDNLTFPLNQPSVRLQSSSEFLKKFKPQTPLEIEIAEILNEGKPVSVDKDENESEFPLTLQEMVERREELIQLRAKQWFRESKAARQKKIKSKKYHRILRKEKIKEQLKDFEVLKKTDPEGALEKLDQLDKTRAEERASLRHRSTGQWARNRAVRAKYDKESRQVLAQQLSISRELTQRVRKEGSSDDEEDDNELPEKTLNSDNNPWVDGGVTTSAEVSEFVSSYRKYWDKKMDDKANKGNEDNKRTVEIVDGDEVLEIEDDGIRLGDQQNKRMKLVESETMTNTSHSKEKLEVNTYINKTKQNKKLQLQTNSSRTVKEQFSKSKTEQSRKRGSTLDKSDKINEELEPDQKRKLSEKKRTNKSNKRKDIRPKHKLVATTPGWIVVPTDVQNVNTASNDQPKKIKHVSVDMDELFDDIDTKFKNKLSKKMRQIKDKMHVTEMNTEPENNEENTSESYLAFKTHASRPVIDEELNEGTNRGPLMLGKHATVPLTSVESRSNHNMARENVNSQNEKNSTSDIDPNRFLAIKPKHLKTQLPDIVTAGEEALDDEAERHMTITEAFAEDDVVAEFRKEKEETVAAPKEKDLNVDMPGWGQWGGKDLPTRPRKKKWMITKKPMEPPRKDSNKGDLIINEKKDDKMKEHLVNTLPFPFTSVKSFEASIRAPIGNTWVPATSFWQLTAPEVTTKLGAIIEPMDENQLINLKNKGKNMNWG